ncbi:hypothetical protein D3C74_164530 [compost metagenome]
MATEKKVNKKSNKWLIIVSISVLHILIIIKLFGFYISDKLPLGFLVELVAYGLYFVMLVVTFVVFLRLRNRKNLMLFLLHIIVLLMLMFIPFAKISTLIEFKLYHTEMENVIDMVQLGKIELKLSENGLLKLPEEYQYLSNGGGEIIVNKSATKFFFYSYRGLLDNFQGFYYSVDNYSGPDSLVDSYRSIENIDEHWFFITS